MTSSENNKDRIFCRILLDCESSVLKALLVANAGVLDNFNSIKRWLWMLQWPGPEIWDMKYLGWLCICYCAINEAWYKLGSVTYCIPRLKFSGLCCVYKSNYLCPLLPISCMSKFFVHLYRIPQYGLPGCLPCWDKRMNTLHSRSMWCQFQAKHFLLAVEQAYLNCETPQSCDVQMGEAFKVGFLSQQDWHSKLTLKCSAPSWLTSDLSLHFVSQYGMLDKHIRVDRS